MSITPVSTSNSDASNLSQVNNMIRQINNEQTTKVFKQAGNIDAKIDGRLPNDLGYGTLLYDQNGVPLIYMAVVNGQPVLKVAPSGIDATTAPDSQLLLNSAQNVFKIVSTGVVDVPDTSTFNSVTVAHGLGYVPVILAYTTYDTNYRQLPVMTFFGDGTARWQVACYVDATNAVFYTESYQAEPGHSATIKYYLLQETAT